MKRRLDYPPLGFPEFSFAHHQPIAKEQGDAFDGLTLNVILTVLTEHVSSMLGVPARIHAGAVDGGFENISESLELVAHPAQEVLIRAVFLNRSGWDLSACRFHISIQLRC